MRSQSHITSCIKLGSGLSYLLFLLCFSALAGYEGYQLDLPSDHIPSEILFSTNSQKGKTISWSQAISDYSPQVSERYNNTNIHLLSRLHGRLFQVAYHQFSLVTQFSTHRVIRSYAMLKIIPKSSEKFLPALSIV